MGVSGRVVGSSKNGMRGNVIGISIVADTPQTHDVRPGIASAIVQAGEADDLHRLAGTDSRAGL